MKYNLSFIMLFSIVLIFNACGGEKSESNEELKPVEFNLTANDQMQYNLKNMVVKEGQKVIIHLKNIGSMPIETMGHNIIIVKPNVDLASFAAKALTAKDNGYIPLDEEEKMVIHSKLLGPGEETTIEFIAPQKGSYKFFCSFPGHYITMQGNFIVR